MQRSLLWILPLSLAIGIAATFAVAWLPYMLPNSWHWRGTVRMWWGEAAGQTWSVYANEVRAISSTRAYGFTSAEFGKDFHERMLANTRRATGVEYLEEFEWPSWSRFESLAPMAVANAAQTGETGDALLTEYATGWPMRAFTGASWKPAGPQPHQLTRDHMMKVGKDFVPTHPIPLGLAVNTVFFTGAAALLLGSLTFGIKASLRLARRRKGFRPHCAYARTGLAPDAPCPECGTAPLPSHLQGPNVAGD